MDKKRRSYRLTFQDAINIWHRFWAGEYQHRIAADYDVNQGRINEVIKEHRHIGSRLIAALTRKDKDAA